MPACEIKVRFIVWKRWAVGRLTEDGDHFVVLNDFEAAGDDEAEAVYALAGVVQQVAGRRVRHHEVHGERPQAAVGREPERRMFVEHFSVQMHANVGLHVLRTVREHLKAETRTREMPFFSQRCSFWKRRRRFLFVHLYHLIRVKPLRHRPRRHHVVHDTLAEGFRHLVQLHEFPHIVQHVVVLGGGRCHLLDDGCHMTENGGVQKR